MIQKTWLKILVIFLCSGLAGALTFSASVWSNYAIVFASFSASISLLSGALTGFPPKEE